jgi:hypothetical protein
MVDSEDIIARPRVEFVDLCLELGIGLHYVGIGIASLLHPFKCGSSKISESACFLVFVGGYRVPCEEGF